MSPSRAPTQPYASACYVISFLALLHATAPTRAAAQSGEQGAVCVHDFSPGVSCQGTDVAVTALTLVEILDPCGADATATLTLDVTLSAAASNRYDAAFYVALNGNSAESGTSCYHDYLAPPLSTTPAFPTIYNGPWANLEPFDQNDSCGDIQANSDVTKTIRTPLLPIQVSCVDSDRDGNVDISVCSSWRSGTSGPQATCSGLSDAAGGSADRCSCARLNVLPEPGAALALACGGSLLLPLAARRRVTRGPRAACARSCGRRSPPRRRPSP
jgi:hypothetical protein